MRIFHIATATDWAEAQVAGAYTTSTRGLSLAEQGFIHASRDDQWEHVREVFFHHASEPLVLLEIETDLLESPWQEDPVGDTSYPHIYGPLNPAAVVGWTALA